MKALKVKLKYGKSGVKASIPGGVDISLLDPGKTAFLPEQQEALKEKLARPAGSKSLRGLAESASRACIVVSDKTRYVPYRVILPEILRTLEESNTEVFFLVAAGMHAPSSPEDLREILGGEIAGKYKIINHSAEDGRELEYLGRGDSGIPVYINRNYCEADLKILTGFIEPHFMAGFSGGRKSVCPGISGLETIKFIHSARILSSPYSRAGCLGENPVNAAISEAAELAGCDFIVNVTLNSAKEITGIFCGGLKEAFGEGVRICAGQCGIRTAGEFDTVITTGGGYPLDRNFYQTVKGLVGALEIIKPGGTLICASECADGLGSDEFRNLLYGMENTAQFMEMIFSEGFFCPDQWEVQELVRVLDKCRVSLYSENLRDEEIIKCGCRPVKDLKEEIARVVRGLGAGARMAVIPEGPYALVDKGAGTRDCERR